MMFKRVVIIMAMILMLTGMVVSATAEFFPEAVAEISIPVVCEVTKPENITTHTPNFDKETLSIRTNSMHGKVRTMMASKEMEPLEIIAEPAKEMVTDAESSSDESDVVEKATVVVEEPVESSNEVEIAKAAEVLEKSENQVEESNQEFQEKMVEEQEVQEVKPLEEGTIVDPSVEVSTIVLEDYTWDGDVLNSYIGTVQGPNGKETYYNLDMTGVIWIMESLGYNYEYSVREDGVKMYGPFIMVAADLDLRPRGSIIKTSLGWGMVCDTGAFTQWNPTQLDIAVAW